jgi:hypothetical protein
MTWAHACRRPQIPARLEMTEEKQAALSSNAGIACADASEI